LSADPTNTQQPSPNNHSSSLRDGEFWANKDISFELRRGECIGLVGHNGAGKTTLLKMLNGLIKPDEGTIEMRGRVGALIALGAGFNPILTGRENIYVSGSILGLTKEEIDEQIDDIIDFAEIRDFIDSPVQSYSSGMQVRLGFSVASSLKPDVLILDEVLAVGDIAFVIKCLNRMREIAADAAVIFVSHTMQFVSSFCTKVMVLDKGKMVMMANDPGEGINCYLEKICPESNKFRVNRSDLLKINFLGIESKLPSVMQITQGDDHQIEIEVFIESATDLNQINIYIDDETQTQIIGYPLNDTSNKLKKFENGLHKFIVPLGKIDLNPGRYSFLFVISETNTNTILLRYAGILPFIVNGEKTTWTKIIRPVALSI
jgi:lipopolysaccharide transport system ATP-binding protein